MNLQTLPRVVVEGYFRTARLPLTAIQRIAQQQDNEQWPPGLAFESFEAGVETMVGALLRDPTLLDKGRLRQAKLTQLRRAAELEAMAAVEREQADEQLAERQHQAADQRAESQRRAEQRTRELERQAELHERKVAAKAAKQTTAARRRKAAQDSAIDSRERVAKTAALAEESRALSTAKQALEADETVDVIEDTLDGSKAARTTGSPQG
jgi:hypothetical protein